MHILEWNILKYDEWNIIINDDYVFHLLRLILVVCEDKEGIMRSHIEYQS